MTVELIKLEELEKVRFDIPLPEGDEFLYKLEPIRYDKWYLNGENNLTIKHVDFSGVRLSGVKFKNISFVNCNFSHAKMSKCRFNNCSLWGCDFENVNLSGSRMHFMECNVSEVKFDFIRNGSLEFNNYNSEDLKIEDVHFFKAALDHLQFSNAELHNISLGTYLHVDEITINGCKVKYSIFDNKKSGVWLDIYKSSLFDCALPRNIFYRNSQVRETTLSDCVLGFNRITIKL